MGHMGWTPDTSAFHLGKRSGMCILDPSYTRVHTARVLAFLAALLDAQGHLLFVSTRGDCQPMVRHVARMLGQSVITDKWIGGTLTNWTQIQSTKGDLSTFPDALIILNPYENLQAIQEAHRMNIPVIAIVDSDTPCHGIEYMIPANDDSDRCIYTFLHLVARVLHVR
jgi:small subunit ribosomal protein S2